MGGAGPPVTFKKKTPTRSWCKPSVSDCGKLFCGAAAADCSWCSPLHQVLRNLGHTKLQTLHRVNGKKEMARRAVTISNQAQPVQVPHTPSPTQLAADKSIQLLHSLTKLGLTSHAMCHKQLQQHC